MWGRIILNHRSLLFGAGAAMVGVAAARTATGLRFKLHTMFDFHTVLNAGARGDIGVAAVSFVLGTLICRAVVRVYPPTDGPCVGLTLMTPMAILLALCVGIGLGQIIKFGHAEFAALSFGLSLAYAHVTTLPTLIVLMAAWTGIWVMLCSEAAAQPSRSSSPLPTVQNIGARNRVWVPPKDLRIVAPRWWLALTFGDDNDTSALRRTLSGATDNGGERQDGPSAATQ